MDATETNPRWSLSELTRETGVSVRTVRYYIAEGLLPPPVSVGPRSFYTQAHLDRLRLIDRLKASYLPLKEIRRRLSTLDDAEVRQLLASDADQPTPGASLPTSPRAPPPRQQSSASDYIARLLHRPDAALPPAAPSARQQRRVEPPAAALDHDVFEEQASFSLPLPAPTPSDTQCRSTSAGESETTSWRRIPLSDDAELLIRDDAYQRKRDRIDWLIDWARKVFN